jgi:hypothetical protein
LPINNAADSKAKTELLITRRSFIINSLVKMVVLIELKRLFRIGIRSNVFLRVG